MARTAFSRDERCFWHANGNYTFAPLLGMIVQPIASRGPRQGYGPMLNDLRPHFHLP